MADTDRIFKKLDEITKAQSDMKSDIGVIINTLKGENGVLKRQNDHEDRIRKTEKTLDKDLTRLKIIVGIVSTVLATVGAVVANGIFKVI